MHTTGSPGYVAEKLAEPHDDARDEWQAGRLGTRRPELEEGDNGGFDLRFLAIAGAIVFVAFFVARGLA